MLFTCHSAAQQSALPVCNAADSSRLKIVEMVGFFKKVSKSYLPSFPHIMTASDTYYDRYRCKQRSFRPPALVILLLSKRSAPPNAMEASSMADLDVSLLQSVQSVINPETSTAELNEAIIDLPAPILAPIVNKSATLAIEIIETLPPCPAQFENKSATLDIDLNNPNLDNPPFCPCPPESLNIELPSPCPLSADAKSLTLAIDVEEGVQTPMTTDNALSVPGNEDDATLPDDEMAIEGTRHFSL